MAVWFHEVSRTRVLRGFAFVELRESSSPQAPRQRPGLLDARVRLRRGRDPGCPLASRVLLTPRRSFAGKADRQWQPQQAPRVLRDPCHGQGAHCPGLAARVRQDCEWAGGSAQREPSGVRRLEGRHVRVSLRRKDSWEPDCGETVTGGRGQCFRCTQFCLPDVPGAHPLSTVSGRV